MTTPGIKIPENAKCEIRGSAPSFDPSIVGYAYLCVYTPDNGKRPRVYPIDFATELTETQQEILLGQGIPIKILNKNETEDDQEDGIPTIISSGRFQDKIIYIKFNKSRNQKLTHEEIILGLKAKARRQAEKMSKDHAS